jgi:hypothetical protein
VYRRLVGKKVTREVLAAELPEMSESELDRCLTGFHEAGWVLHDRMHLLALSVPHRDSIV